jgi:hypothetical protein
MKTHLIPTTLSMLVATSLLIGASAKAEGLSAEEQQFMRCGEANREAPATAPGTTPTGRSLACRETHQWFVAAV